MVVGVMKLISSSFRGHPEYLSTYLSKYSSTRAMYP